MATTLSYSNLIFHEKIGEGGYGTVRRVTFKEPFMDQTEAAAKSVSKLEQREVDILGKLNHPNIVGLFGLIQEGPITCIVLEYAPNGTVHDYIKNNGYNPTPDHLCIQWMTESAIALEYLHRNNVIHRDLKGPNCLLFEDYKLKLSDFGLARELFGSVTTSSIKGTYRYMAPEIHEDSHYSFGSDMWAYGMLMVEISSGREPFHGLDWITVVYRVTEDGLNPDIPKCCPKNIAQILRQCWDRDPKGRPSAASVAVFLSGLGQHGEGSIEWNDTLPSPHSCQVNEELTAAYTPSETERHLAVQSVNYDEGRHARSQTETTADVPIINPSLNLPQPETADVLINSAARLTKGLDLSWEASVWDYNSSVADRRQSDVPGKRQRRHSASSSSNLSEDHRTRTRALSMVSAQSRSTGTQTPKYRRDSFEKECSDIPFHEAQKVRNVDDSYGRSRRCCLIL